MWLVVENQYQMTFQRAKGQTQACMQGLRLRLDGQGSASIVNHCAYRYLLPYIRYRARSRNPKSLDTLINELSIFLSFCHLASSISFLSSVLNLTVIVLFAASVVLKLSKLELVYTKLWWSPESIWDKHCPLDIWSESYSLSLFDDRVACPWPLFMGEGVPSGDASCWPVCLLCWLCSLKDG